MCEEEDGFLQTATTLPMRQASKKSQSTAKKTVPKKGCVARIVLKMVEMAVGVQTVVGPSWEQGTSSDLSAWHGLTPSTSVALHYFAVFFS